MFFLQASGGEPGILVGMMVLRLVGIIVCVNKAKELNRSQEGWGIFGFLMPIVAIIWVSCLKPKVVWNDETKRSQP